MSVLQTQVYVSNLTHLEIKLLDLIEQVVEVSGGCKIQLTGGELLFTSADLETVSQFLILYRDVLLSDKE